MKGRTEVEGFISPEQQTERDADESSGQSGIADVQLKKRELLDRIVERSGVSKQYARPVLEAALELLGEAVAEGREMNLQPLGKVKVQRSKDVPNARITVVKIRQGLSGNGAKESVADTAK